MPRPDARHHLRPRAIPDPRAGRNSIASPRYHSSVAHGVTKRGRTRRSGGDHTLLGVTGPDAYDLRVVETIVWSPL